MGAVQEASPEVASVAAKLTVSGAVYQPDAFGWRDGAAVVCGAVASYLIAYDAELELPALSLQMPASAVVAMSGPE